MRIVVFGLTISSSWGNGHATLWRGLCRALARAGHHVVFYERDQPYYAEMRDLRSVPGGRLVLYRDWDDVRHRAAADIAEADAAIVTSYCPDSLAATELIEAQNRALGVFYDLDSPITLARLEQGEEVSYIGANGLAGFDLVLSYAGGSALAALADRLGARAVAPLYGHVDPELHRPVPPQPHYQADLSYLGTYSADRQQGITTLLLEPAAASPTSRFLIGGAQYPSTFPWSDNIYFVQHLPPSEHPAFFSSSRLTLNVTRRPMAEMGWCPSGRLFEAAACGVPVISDAWEGLDRFFRPGEEILTAEKADDVIAAVDRDDQDLRRIARRARERTLAEHTSTHRAAELIGLLERGRRPLPLALSAVGG